jgi:hypothetical protein
MQTCCRLQVSISRLQASEPDLGSVRAPPDPSQIRSAGRPAVAGVSRPTPDTVCSVEVYANGIDEGGFALAASTPPVQPTRRLALQSVDSAVRNAG